MVETALEMIKKYLDGDYDPLHFSLDMESFLCNQYDAMHEENPGLTEFLNEDMPEICAEFERDMYDAELEALRADVKRIYEQALTYLE